MGLLFFFSMALPSHSGPWPLIQFCNHFSQTVGLLGRVQLVSRPVPKHRTTQTHKIKRIYTPNINALSGIRTYDPSVRASEGSSCLRSRGCCDRRMFQLAAMRKQTGRLNQWLCTLSIVAVSSDHGYRIAEVKAED
jgi:hypothetical protein